MDILWICLYRYIREIFRGTLYLYGTTHRHFYRWYMITMSRSIFCIATIIKCIPRSYMTRTFFVTLFCCMTIVSCSKEKPMCPEIPIYPGVTSLGFTENASVQRVKIYQVRDNAHTVVNYYRNVLNNNEWKFISEGETGFTAHYIATGHKPSFSLSLVVISEKQEITTFEVYLTIGTPYSWNSGLCTHLQP